MNKRFFLIGLALSLLVLPISLAEDFKGLFSPLDKEIIVQVENGNIVSCSFVKDEPPVIIPNETITHEVCSTIMIDKPRDQWAYWEQFNYMLNGIVPYQIPSTICQQIEIVPNISLSDRKLAYTVYTTSSAIETIDTLKKHFITPNGNYLFEDSDERVISKTFDHSFNYIIGSASYQHIVDVKFDQARELDFNSNDIVNYDIEDWDSTSQQEKNDLIGSIKRSSLLIRSKGYKSGVTPDGNMIMEKYQEIDWADVDFLGIQLQRYSDNPAKAKEWSKRISEYVKSRNPHTEIFVQFSLRQAGSIGQLEDTLKEVSNIQSVDGFIITFMPHDYSNNPTHACDSTLCNGINLDRVLTYIENL